MNKIIEQIENLKSMIQNLEDEVKKSTEVPESNYQKLLKEIKQLNIANLFQNDGDINLEVLCSNTKKYPILDDFLDEYFTPKVCFQLLDY